MTLLTVGRRRTDAGTEYPLPLSALAAPWNSSDVPCVIPTPDGSGATIHPSVLDMGTDWNGYRWWMANTPYANMNDDLENPCIWASNDRRTWTVPAGLTNPIDPDPGNPWFHSDTELVWDPEGDRMVVFYRLASAATSPPTIYLRAQSSTDGVTWTNHGTLLQFPGAGARLSPAIQRVGPDEWRMWTWGDKVAAHHWSATNPLGPWADQGACTSGGSSWLGWHGDVIHAGGAWRSAYSVDGNVRLVSSSDGVAWSAHTTIATGGAGGGWDTAIYRPTLLPSTEAGYIDCWYSGYGAVPGGCATDYVRLPLTLWPTPPA